MNMRDGLLFGVSRFMFFVGLILFLSLGAIFAAPPVEASENSSIFTDIKQGSEYEEALTSLVEQKIIMGYSDGTYRASEHLNRGQAAMIIARALQLNLVTVDDPGFQDVSETSEAYKSIAAVVGAGIFEGYADGTFKPDQSLTRAEMAKILVVAYQLPEEQLTVNPFKDVSSTSWYASYLTSLIQHQITLGTTLTTYSPDDPVSRGDMALFIYRCQQLSNQLTERIIESEVTAITSHSIQLDNETFALTDDLRTWITPENLPILKNSRIKAQLIEGRISRIESITLRADGLVSENAKNRNVVLAGNGAIIDATVIIDGDNLSIKEATITGDLIIESDVQTSLYLEKVLVQGATMLKEPRGKVAAASYHPLSAADINDNHHPTLHLHHSSLQSIKASRSFIIQLTGGTKIDEIDLFVDARIEADARLTIPIVRIGTGSINTALHAVIDSLVIDNRNSRITLGNNAVIENIQLESRHDVKFIVLDYELVKHKIIRINGLPNLDLYPPVGGTSGNSDDDDNDDDDNHNEPPDTEEDANLIAAKTAVARLFLDDTKTTLSASVDQDAIDEAKAKVDLVADGVDKTALVNDLLLAQQLLNAQLDESAKLQAAIDAVNGLFKDSTKTALNAGVDQNTINDAMAKVDLLAEGADKTALKNDIALAQKLLIQTQEPPLLTGAAPNADTVLFTFTDDAAWRSKITGIYLNGNSSPIHFSRVNTSTAGIIEINLTGASLTPGLHDFLIKAEGYADVAVTVEVAAPLAAPNVSGTAPNVDTVLLTFTDDAAWRNKITGVYLNGNSWPIHSSRVNTTTAGIVEIDLTGASLTPGLHDFLIKAEGYADVAVTVEVDAPLAAPIVSGTAPNSETVMLTFTDDAAWRNKITGVYLNGYAWPIHSSRVNTTTAGKVEINLTGASLTPGLHDFLIKAEGYADVTVTVEVAAPLAAPIVSGTAPNSETVMLTFTDDAAWRNKITGVYLNGNSLPIHSSRVNTTTAGIVEINLAGASLTTGLHDFLIKAEGYADVAVTVEVAAPLAAPSLSGTAPNPDTVLLTFTDDAAWRSKITDVYFYRDDVDVWVTLHPSRVDTSTAGTIVLNFVQISLAPGTHDFKISADGYEDAMTSVHVGP